MPTELSGTRNWIRSMWHHYEYWDPTQSSMDNQTGSDRCASCARKAYLYQFGNGAKTDPASCAQSFIDNYYILLHAYYKMSIIVP